jgi:hypothetical protein
MPWDRWHVGVLSSASRWREHVVPKLTKILDSVGLASSPPLRRTRAPHAQLDFDPVLSVA